MQEARDKGIEETIIKLTKKMLDKDTDIKYISEITGLSIDEITKIRDEL